MTRFMGLAALTAAITAPGPAALAETVRDVVGPTPFLAVAAQPAPKLFVDAPLSGPLSRGAVFLQYRVENLRIVPVFGTAAVDVSPRVGHLHIAIDDLPWHWADASDDHTVVVVGLPPGPHKISVSLADPQHRVLAEEIVRFTIPARASHAH